MASNGLWYPPESAPGGPHPQPRYNGLAVASMVVGIMSLLFVWLAAGALVAGFRALGQITDSHTEQKGRSMAMAGIVLAVISVLVWLAAIQW